MTDDRTPAPLPERLHACAVATLREAIAEMQRLERHFATRPEDVAGFGPISDRVGDLLLRAQQEVVQFWNASDCTGEG